MITIVRYEPTMQAEWDNHVRISRNGTFLHERAFMDYHSDRFVDCSLIARDETGHLVAVLPANREGDTLCSHRGLSYGGWLMAAKHCDASVMLMVVEALRQWMVENGFKRLIYKPVPHIYHRYPADDDIYAMWRAGAKVDSCSISSTIDLAYPLPMNRGNKSGQRVAERAGITVGEDIRWDDYWQILTEVLAARHDTRPVHTLDEILLLHSRFPENIRLYTARHNDRVVAGVVMFFTPMVAHAQYIASSAEGRDMHALSLLFAHLREVATNRCCRYLDFGISTEDGGRVLNEGLLQQKSRLGGRGTLTQVLELNC
ncbi:MAG: GNAT family N-acetyltransferase [Muribaculaceae bacterium]|nr:GNAT family N-acetyltransferase [Muribaculaceae bacterium]